MILTDQSFGISQWTLSAWRGVGSLWGWIRTIAASKALMRYRREKVRATEELDEELEGDEDEEGEGYEDYDDIVDDLDDEDEPRHGRRHSEWE